MSNNFFERRAFLRSGGLFLTAVAAPVASAVERFPQSMLVPGQTSEPYGSPASYEADQVRSGGQRRDLTTLSSSYTPIHLQKGIVTPSGLHYTVHHSGVPDINPVQHRLYIHGMVKQPLKFSVEDLMRYPMRGGIHFLECAGNSWRQGAMPDPQNASCQDIHGLLSGSEWFGVPAKILLDQVALKPRAKWVIAEGGDAHSMARSIPLEKMMYDGIIALYQNGERLRPEQGYPMRLFLPGWEGNTNVKWLRRLEVVDQPAYTKDESREYTETLADGTIQRFSMEMEVKSVITHPTAGQRLPQSGFYEVSGLAWSGQGAIKSVEIADDAGNQWVKAELQGPVLPTALTRFAIPWKWDGKPTRLRSRAIDETGNVQLSHQEWGKQYAPGSYNHYNAIQAWNIDADGVLTNVF